METADMVNGQVPARSVRLPATLMRGGSSKCWVFEASDLPDDLEARGRIFSAAYGGADPRQINGIGGGTSTTSKAIVMEGVDAAGAVLYSFAQVSIDRERVEWSSNCGNCATAVALYAVQSGLVNAGLGRTSLVVRNIRTGLSLEAEVATPGGRVTNLFDDDTGTSAPGVPVSLVFRPSSWSTFGVLLPSSAPMNVVDMDGSRIRVSLVDAGAPAVLAVAADMGMTGSESLPQVEARSHDFARLRALAAVKMGLPEDGVAIPKVGIVGPPSHEGEDLTCRMISMTAPHPSIGLTSAVAVAASAGLEGSSVRVVSNLDCSPGMRPLRIGTAAGTVDVDVSYPGPSAARINRSSRRLVNGSVFVPLSVPTAHHITSTHRSPASDIDANQQRSCAQ